jgi:putative flippase GtrA
VRPSRELSLQLARFTAVGAGNTIVSYVVFASLVAVTCPYRLAGAAAFAAGAVNGYRLNRRWTFESEDGPGRLLRYAAVQMGGLVATTLLLGFFVEEVRLGRLVSYGLTVVVVTLATFAANRSWVFAERQAEATESMLPRRSLATKEARR